MQLADQPVPDLPGPRWVKLRTVLGGICGTDLALVFQRNHPATILQRFARFPCVLGHENVAVIESVGREVTTFVPGQRVCIEPALGCQGRGIDPPCLQCAAGRTSLCEHFGDGRMPPRALMGLNPLTGGSWGEYFVAHESQVHRVPDVVSDEAAVLVDPIASAAHAVLRRTPRSGERIFINGSGIIAMGLIASIRAMGLDNQIWAAPRHNFQAGLMRKLGATTLLNQSGFSRRRKFEQVASAGGGRCVEGRFGNLGAVGGFDLVYDCTGTGAGLSDSMKWTRARGSVVAVGTSGITLVDTTPLWFDELEVIGANGRQVELEGGRTLHSYELVFDWLTHGRLDLSVLPISRYPLSQYRAAFAHLASRGKQNVVKAVFDFRSPTKC